MLQSYSLLVLAWHSEQKAEVRSEVHCIDCSSLRISAEMNCDNMAQALLFSNQNPFGLN